MRSRFTHFVAFVCAISAAAVLAAAPQKTRTIHISVTDKAGVAVPNLSAADVTVREDGQAREVISVKPTSTPMSLALLVDNSHVTQSMTQDLRNGVAAFVTALLKQSPDSTVSFSTFGERPTPVQDFTSSAAVITKASGRLISLTGSGSYMLDAIVDATKAFKKIESPRKVIVAFVDESGEEFSSAARQQVFEAVKNSGASVWVVVMQGGGPATQTIEGRDRSAVIGDLPHQSGGATLTILTKLALAEKMTHVANMLAHEFEVTYGRPDQLIPPSKLEVTVATKNVNVAAPRWTDK